MDLVRKRPLRFRVQQLAKELAALREARGYSLTYVAAQTGINESTIYRAEHPTTRVSNRSTIGGLLDFYGVNKRERARLLALIKPATELPEALHAYDDVDLDQAYRDYIALENDAASIANYESLYLPGLLQTPEYAFAAIRGSLPNIPAAQARRLARLRAERQAILSRPEPLRVNAVVDEAAVRRVVGGREVMAEQLGRLAGLPPHVSVRVIPYAAGAHPGMSGSLAVLTFLDRDLDPVVYIDSMDGDRLHEDPPNVDRYQRMFRQIESAALPEDRSAALIAEVANEIGR